VEITIEKLKRYKSPGNDQILAELIKPGGETLCSEIHKLIHSTWDKESIIIPIYKNGEETGCSNY
jgi:hypothetical protein